jgi:hypothetical protein
LISRSECSRSTAATPVALSSCGESFSAARLQPSPPIGVEACATAHHNHLGNAVTVIAAGIEGYPSALCPPCGGSSSWLALASAVAAYTFDANSIDHGLSRGADDGRLATRRSGSGGFSQTTHCCSSPPPSPVSFCQRPDAAATRRKARARSSGASSLFVAACPIELWALSTTPGDTSLRNRLYERVGLSEGLRRLSRMFPNGSAMD